MKRIPTGLMTIVLALGIHTSAMAADVWMDEQRITALNQNLQYTERGYTFRSSDPTVASVTADGKVYFHKEGRAVITMTRGDVTIHQPYRVKTASIDVAAFSEEVIRLVNEQRARYGLHPLQEDVRYQICADIRAEELTSVFSHTRPNGQNCFSVLREHGVNYLRTGENIAAGQGSPAEVVASWMGSEGHRANILSSDYTHLMVGCRQGSDGALYWVQLFTER